jgi:predicted phage-related endonuclease
MSTPIAGPMPGTQEWTDIRFYDPDRKGREVIFGASEAAAALGMSPYTQPLELYLVKRREMPTNSDSMAMRLGRRMEPIVLDEYEERTGVALTRSQPMYFHPDLSYMAATPDALTSGPDRWAVDAKTSTFRRYDAFGVTEDDDKFGKEGGDHLPLDYILQAQQQMAVLGMDRVDFPVLFDGSTLRLYTVRREESLIAALGTAEKELAERIADARPPEPNWQHPNTRQCLQALYGLQEGLKVDLGEEAAEHWQELQRLKVQLANLEAEIDERKNRVLAAIGSAEIGRLPGGAKELKRTVIKDSIVTQADVDKLAARVGQVGRKGHERLTERKSK